MNRVDAVCDGGLAGAQRIARVQHAGRAAQRLRPAGYDAELVALLAMLQNLGRLALRYHFPEEAAQIRRLMQPTPPLAAGLPEQTGRSEESACLAALGVDVDALRMAVGRHWGFDDQALWMMRRLSPSVSDCRRLSRAMSPTTIETCCA